MIVEGLNCKMGDELIIAVIFCAIVVCLKTKIVKISIDMVRCHRQQVVECQQQQQLAALMDIDVTNAYHLVKCFVCLTTSTVSNISQ